MKQRIAYVFLYGLAEAIRAVSQPHNRYAVTFRVLDWLGRRASKLYYWRSAPVHRASPTAELLNHVLCYFTRRNIAFDLPVVVTDLGLLQDTLKSGRGAIIATAHTRISCALHKGLLQHGIKPVFVGLADASQMKYNWGHPDPIALIAANTKNLFGKFARSLNAGDVVVTYVDYPLPRSEPNLPAPVGISPNAFVWAARRDVPVLLMTNRIDRAGTIHVALHKPECSANAPSARGHEMAQAMGMLMRQNLGWDYSVKRPRHRRALHHPPAYMHADATAQP